MTDITCSSNEDFSDELSDNSDDMLNDNDMSPTQLLKDKVDSRRRLEEALERRFLEKDVQEFLFDY